MTPAVAEELPIAPPAASAALEPVRVRLARVAAAAAAAVPGVVRLDAGPTAGWMTAVSGPDRIEGIRSAAGPDGYDVAVQLVATPVPLPALSEAVRTSVRQAAAAAGLAADLGRVDVHVSGLADGALG